MHTRSSPTESGASFKDIEHDHTFSGPDIHVGKAVHVTTSNDRAIGIEIAKIGAYPTAETKELDEWYQHDAKGRTYIKIPGWVGDPLIHRKDFTGGAGPVCAGARPGAGRRAGPI
jgi:hypothetical protein